MIDLLNLRIKFGLALLFSCSFSVVSVKYHFWSKKCPFQILTSFTIPILFKLKINESLILTSKLADEKSYKLKSNWPKWSRWQTKYEHKKCFKDKIFLFFKKKNGKALKPLHSCKVFWFSWGKKSFFIIVFLSKILAAKKKIIFQAIFQKIKFLHFNFKMILPKINHFLCYWVVQTIFPKRKTFLFLLKAFNPNFALGWRETGLKPWNWISKESLIHPRMLLKFNQSIFAL